MSRPAARLGDRVTGTDTHIVLVPSPGGPVPTPTQLPFSGTITSGCCATVLIGGRPAATIGSRATNVPPHVPPTGTFARPPENSGSVSTGDPRVLIGGRAAARNGDTVVTCSDPVPAPNCRISAAGNVHIG
ncbi:PAAR domain-containing protein [Streptomyces sp. TRM70350]|uniref:PAAR domain-containing protein n=1 Tax=Streptomyces sp. TRM70350 TaxID=2856165 RepID=UPI001C48BB32|nr:PAAR domain-containing protein [Streptomyces sp. TRM70350]MBV7696560.1 PAAR domain-containing protein [Streptomyces sp. TRM70350]